MSLRHGPRAMPCTAQVRSAVPKSVTKSQGDHQMRPMRPIDTAHRGGSARRTPRVFAAAALAAVLTLTASACGPEEDGAIGEPSSSTGQSSDGKVAIPDDLKDRLKEHGIDLGQVEGRRVEELGQGQLAA